MESIRCIVLGDSFVGKTSWLMSHCIKRFPEDYMPTIHDSYYCDAEYNGKKLKVNLIDTSADETCDRLRQSMLKSTDAVIMCYSIVDPCSFSNITTKWYEEVKHYNSNAPIVLLATKSDLRANRSNHYEKLSKPIEMQQGNMLSKMIHAVEFIECSALQRENLQQIIDAIVISVSKQKTCKCAIL